MAWQWIHCQCEDSVVADVDKIGDDSDIQQYIRYRCAASAGREVSYGFALG
jgi:hypothetical protein